MSLFENLKTREVFLSNDASLYGLALRALDEEKIAYKQKVVNSGTQNRCTGTFLGNIGENPSRQIFYYIYVAPKDEERAKYIISQYLRG